MTDSFKPMRSERLRVKITTQQFNNACLYIGQLIIPFASVENSLDIIIMVIHKAAKGRNHPDKLPSIPLKRRLDFVKDSLKNIPALASFRSEGISVMGEIKSESTIRNSCLHGYISAFDENTNRITFTLLDSYKDRQTHTKVSNSYTGQELLDAGARVVNLAGRTHVLALQLISAFELEIDEIRRSGGVMVR